MVISNVILGYIDLKCFIQRLIIILCYSNYWKEKIYLILWFILGKLLLLFIIILYFIFDQLRLNGVDDEPRSSFGIIHHLVNNNIKA